MTDVTNALRDLDTRIQALGLNIWIGGEPTFTDRFSAAPEWSSNALGGDKEVRANQLARYLAATLPGCAILRTVGKQYPNESSPRWSIGILSLRNGDELWHGPPDPQLVDSTNLTTPDLLEFRQALTDTLHRNSIHAEVVTTVEGNSVAIELPELTNADVFLSLLAAIEIIAINLQLPALVLRGYPPPADQRLLWQTITPDPAVIEINQAPAINLVEQLQLNQALFEAASKCNLYPYRLHYNGRESDSGGGGQLTIGGPTPETSPFFLQPKLLPRLIRYFNHHPSLSYWLAMESLGSGSQAPRPDEGPRERWLELAVALEQLERHTPITPEFLWASLSPLLVDAAGNSHRTELNIEKLMNPSVTTKGQLGLVELRPLRMASNPETLTATAALLRAIVARLMQHPFEHPLQDWGDRLHGQFALPYYLHLDLQFVLADLAAYQLGLGNAVTDLLLDDARYEIGQVEWQGVKIRVLSALEFWPLIGDSTAQPRSDSRLIDASTARLELRLTVADDCNLDYWKLRINGFAASLAPALNNSTTRLAGIRYRCFDPWIGLHPKMPAADRVTMILEPTTSTLALELTVFEWQPQGDAYPGLPTDVAEARQRRRERLVVSEIATASLPKAKPMPANVECNCYFDIRRLPN